MKLLLDNGQTSAVRSIERTQGGDLNPQDRMKRRRRTTQRRITATQGGIASLRRWWKEGMLRHRQECKQDCQDMAVRERSRRTRIHNSRCSELAAVLKIPCGIGG